METRSLLQGILDASPDAISIFETVYDESGSPADFRLVMTNQVSASIMALSMEHAVGRLFSELTPEELQNERFNALKQVSETGKPLDREVYTHRTDGLYLWVKSSFRRFENYVVVTYTDITKRKEAETQREIQTTLLERVFATTLLGIVVYQAVRSPLDEITNFRVVKVNRVAKELISGSADITGQLLTDLFPESVTPATMNRFRNVCETGIPFEIEYYYLPLAKWYNIVGVQLGDGLMLTYVDITARKQAEEASTQQSSLLLRISESVKIGILTTEPILDDTSRIIDFRYTYFNEQAKNSLPPDWQQVSDQTVRSINFAGNADQMVALLTHVVETGETLRRETITPDGKIIFSVVSKLGTGTIITFLDVTQQRQAEEQARYSAELEQKVADRTQALSLTLSELEQSRNELERALAVERELSELKVRFVSMASHEFRTPLTTILTSTSLLEKYAEITNQQDRQLKHIERIKIAVKHLNDILEEFLSLEKLQEGQINVHPVAVDLSQLVSETVHYIQDAFGQKQSIEVALSCPGSINLDPSLFRKILINLLSNAVKYSGPETEIKIQAFCDNSLLILSVQDQGIGISEDDQKRLFERFFRAKNVSTIQGTGLGLHIVNRYIRLMGGQINLASELNVGTTLTVTLPI
ncbi:ATP-binding protein [Spirosoma linguale]|uniref:histidine kinase n=1 Tax=Spirosoma linguale (strain ATCC 33905 / DSM 74 / LMG 10896 / Claus 1) TaxID=504472 RepID=D2QBQ9_SPILD|nr:PAS/PAC sensor signal transduction histidine kinase [Spirosoma linguale DSM 74]